MAEVVGEGDLVVGVHVGDDALFHGVIFGGLVLVCHDGGLEVGLERIEGWLA